MRFSRLVGASVSVVAATAVFVPVSVTSVANAAPVTVGIGAAVAAPAPLTPAQIKAAKLAKRAAWAKDMRKRIVKFAKSRQGRGQYVAGAESSWAFDCSGFTKVVYQRVAKINIPHYSGAQLNLRRGLRVSKSNLLPGDILAWGSNGSQHVSIYIGKGKMIGANNPSRDVVIEPINNSYWAPRYAGARRLIVG